MPTPDLTLQPTYVLISSSASVLGGQADGSTLNFGTIELIYETSDTFIVGDLVMYDTSKQILVIYDGVQYALIKEEFILYKENPAP